MDFLTVLSETGCAEFGSALEMLAACKQSETPGLAAGYFSHARDEYNHASIFFSLLKSRAQKSDTKISRNYRFKPDLVLRKGYVSPNGYLVETMSKKDFVAFVYANELLAKSSFSKILAHIEATVPEDAHCIRKIMDEELRHHGMAKSYFLKTYPRMQPLQLSLYKIREDIKNRSRKFYNVNLRLLDNIFNPIYSAASFMLTPMIKYINLSHYRRTGSNLMDLSPSSII